MSLTVHASKLPIHRVSLDPLVLVAVAGRHLESTLAVVDAATERRYAVLCQIWWAVEVDLAILRRQYRRVRARHPRAQLVYLANSRGELELLRAVGMPAVLCNHNAFVDEERYTPAATESARHRAIYNAALAPYKRHALACEVDDLALVTYSLDAPDGYAVEIHAAMTKATWLNFAPPDRFTWLDEREVRDHVASSRVGLCLSREEGAMYASIEYLLCGVPIVSTPSIGGRDAFFDDEYTLVVEPEPNAIARAVDEMIRRAPRPASTRERTLERMREHRARYDAAVEELAAMRGGEVPRTDRVRGAYTNRMFRWESPDRVRELVTRS